MDYRNALNLKKVESENLLPAKPAHAEENTITGGACICNRHLKSIPV